MPRDMLLNFWGFILVNGRGLFHWHDVALVFILEIGEIWDDNLGLGNDVDVANVQPATNLIDEVSCRQ